MVIIPLKSKSVPKQEKLAVPAGLTFVSAVQQIILHSGTLGPVAVFEMTTKRKREGSLRITAATVESPVMVEDG